MPVNDFLYVKKCCERIEEKMQWGESQQWTKTDFEKLSDVISSSSGISISSSTLKRLFGRAKTYKDFYQPQLATKNALAQFIGFPDWEEFRKSTLLTPQPAKTEPIIPVTHRVESMPVEKPDFLTAAEPTPAPIPFAAKKKPALPLWSIVLFSAVLTAGTGMYFYRHSFPHSAQKAVFRGKFLKGDAPLHASFYYDVSGIKSNNVYLETDRERILLDKNDHFANYYYKSPNVYKARLITDEEELSEVNVHALSEGWEGVIRNESTHRLIPRKELGLHKGYLSLSEEMLGQVRQEIKDDFWVEYVNINDFNVDCDNYTLETRVRNNRAEGGIPCFDVEVEVLGEWQKERVRLVEPTCSRWTRVEFGEVRVDGSFSKLPSLAQDLSEWSKIKVEVRNKTARIYCKDKLVYTTRYKKSAGKAKGIILRFKGNGAVDYVRLYNPQQLQVYQDEFDNFTHTASLP